MAANHYHKDIPGNPSTATSSKFTLSDRSNGRPLKILTEDDWDFWVANGYLVLRNAVPLEFIQRTAKLLWEFEEKDPENPDTWYAPSRAEMKMKELKNSGMVEIYNHQFLWDIRQYPKVYDTFCDIWGTDELWVTIDRANLNLPARPGFDFPGFIHWDYDPETKPQNVQGLVALNDQTDENVGGFQCIPELYRTYDSWKETQPADRDRFMPDVAGFEITKVLLKAGDLLIFNSTLPHGIRPNLSEDKVRMAQYVSMMPAENHNNALREWRIRSWQERLTPEGYAFPGDPRNWEKNRYPQAELTELGRKLLGVDPW
ncbi:MAG: phytanoyl-CoA dioxygenase family protein [Lunatimonas sp.]|uniref:phytanoyl-CoA dioxygenase family protein n=1 Tax=Lunatimonas sp. TaxID=2060141 RepID=UPI00263B46F6|nr:phytanoyl-CoA dioxygenase family protein [Lunatimonas sp.]MCC5936655.1 phytanoyl-CoA dioxygenase family protein [Lunatimonas sp.]